jgi:hypothetical protein
MQRFQALFRRQPQTAAKPVSTPKPLAPADLNLVAGGLPVCPIGAGRAATPAALPETKS